MTEGSTAKSTYKVGRLIEKYDLAGFEETLVDRWLGVDGERESLRNLAEQLNKRILRSAMNEAGFTPLDHEIENYYVALVDDRSDAGASTRARRELERGNVEVEGLLEDFTTHQAVHTYLREHHGLEFSAESKASADYLETIEKLENRFEAVTETVLEQMTRAGLVRLGKRNIIVNVTVICQECGGSYDIRGLFDAGACDCEEAP